MKLKTKLCIPLIFVVLNLMGCQTINLTDTDLKRSLLLGSIGIESSGILENEFTQVSFPEIEEKIRLGYKRKKFSKNTLKTYNQKSEKKLEINDSLNIRPEYFQIELSDKVDYLMLLNSSTNKDLRQYLINTRNGKVVTELSIYFGAVLTEKLNSSSDLYLIQDHQKSAAIEIIKADNSREVIRFSEGEIFDFEVEALCWEENYKREPIIAAFKKEGRCPGSTKRNPKKVHSEDIFEKI